MTTIVSKLEGPLSEIILAEYGKVLSEREVEMLDHCQKLGEVWIGYVDGHFVCCWGLIPPSFLSNQAYIWMWALESVPHQFLFVRHSQIQVRKFLRRYASIIGHCKTGNTAAHRWLRWLGAEFNEPDGDLRTFVINRSA